jgi:Kef-type K+ transport system membrane component KefB
MMQKKSLAGKGLALFSIITDVLIVLAAALIVGEIFERFHFPSVVGEILAGMIIGPSLLGLVTANEPLQAVTSIALFFIIFHIGFELRTTLLNSKIGVASIFSLTSFLIPLSLMVLSALLFFPFTTQENLIIALAIAVPSLSIVSVLIWQYKLLQTRTGQIILASVTISDMLAFIILVAIVKPLETTITTVLEIAVFMALYLLLDRILNKKPEFFQKIVAGSQSFFKRTDFSFAMLIIVALMFSAIFLLIGLSYILGAFFAGLIVHDGLIGKKSYDRVCQTLSTMNNIFFIPLFFGFAGLEVVLASINYFDYIGMAVLIIIALGVGVSLTYYVSKKYLHSQLDMAPKQLAGILGGRGAIGIVVATVALDENSLSESGFSLIILATLIISLVIPFLAGRVIKEKKEKLDSCITI